MRKTLGILSCALSAALLFSGCAPQQHVHSFQSYIILEPTCEDEGLIEQVCSECGEKTYIELVATGHRWVNGVCSVCGERETVTDPPDSVDLTLFTTIDEIYEQSTLLGYLYSREVFLDNLNNTTFSDLYINGLGRLKAMADGISADVGDVRADIPMPQEAVLQTILSASILDGKLFISDTTGKTQFFGWVDGLEQTGNVTVIQALAVNLQNELLLLQESGDIIKVGTLNTRPMEVSEELMLYLASEDATSYSVYGPFDRNTSEVTITPTHLGLPVRSVAVSAFADCTNLSRIALPEGIENIGNNAFYNCTSMEYIVLPASLDMLGVVAFLGCNAMQQIFYCGTQAQWNRIEVQSSYYNYSINDYDFGNEDATVYFYSENQPVTAGNYWRYVNGVPTVWRWQWV